MRQAENAKGMKTLLWWIPILLIAAAGGLFIFVITQKGFVTVPQGQAYVVERLGKFNRVITGGLHLRIPFLETFHLVGNVNRDTSPRLGKYGIDLREQIFDVKKQRVITHDNVNLEVDTIFYYRVVAPEKAVYGISDLPEAIEQLALTYVRDESGKMDLDRALSSRQELNSDLKSALEEATSKWGVQITRVEVQEIIPPLDLKDTMEKQMIAERDKRAKVLAAQAEKESMILTAEGAKQQAILEAEARKTQEVLKAEAEKQRIVLEAEASRQQQVLMAQGKREAVILESEGEKTARINLAEGDAATVLRHLSSQAEGLAQISQALNQQGSNDALLAIKSLEAAVQAAEKIANGQATKIYFPQEFSGLMGSLMGLAEGVKLIKKDG